MRLGEFLDLFDRLKSLQKRRTLSRQQYHAPENKKQVNLTANGNGYKLALMGFDFQPRDLPFIRQCFKAYLEHNGYTITDQELSSLNHSWEFATYSGQKKSKKPTQ